MGWRKFRYLTIMGLLFTLSSCSSDSKVESLTNDRQSAASYISQADQMYTQREDLARLQQGIVFLRQAAVADPDSYDAAWRLAKFNYYMAKITDRYRPFRTWRLCWRPYCPTCVRFKVESFYCPRTLRCEVKRQMTVPKHVNSRRWRHEMLAQKLGSRGHE